MHYYCGFHSQVWVYKVGGDCLSSATFKVVFPECTCGDALDHTTSQSAAQAVRVEEHWICPTGFLFLSFLSGQVGGISAIRRFRFPPSRSDCGRADPELWSSRKCHWWRSSSPSPGTAHFRNRCTGSAGEDGRGTLSPCPQAGPRPVWKCR